MPLAKIKISDFITLHIIGHSDEKVICSLDGDLSFAIDILKDQDKPFFSFLGERYYLSEIIK